MALPSALRFHRIDCLHRELVKAIARRCLRLAKEMSPGLVSLAAFVLLLLLKAWAMATVKDFRREKVMVTHHFPVSALYRFRSIPTFFAPVFRYRYFPVAVGSGPVCFDSAVDPFDLGPSSLCLIAGTVTAKARELVSALVVVPVSSSTPRSSSSQTRNCLSPLCFAVLA